MGKDIDKNTSSRYFIGLRISRLRGKKNSENEAIEYYVETSQSYVTVKPILIAEFKENRESLDYTWSWIQDKWATEMKEFKVTFRSRVITIHFLKPKFIGDGKGYLMLLNVPRAYCYLCTIDLDHAQNIEELCKHGMVINRSVEDMWEPVDMLMKKMKRFKIQKGFKEIFNVGSQLSQLLPFHFIIYLQCTLKSTCLIFSKKWHTK